MNELLDFNEAKDARGSPRNATNSERTFKREISFLDSSKMAPTYSRATDSGTVCWPLAFAGPVERSELNCSVPSPAKILAILTGGIWPCMRATVSAS